MSRVIFTFFGLAILVEKTIIVTMKTENLKTWKNKRLAIKVVRKIGKITKPKPCKTPKPAV